MTFNIVDGIILASLLLAVFDGWRRGVFLMLLDLVSFGLAIGAAAYFYEPVGRLLGGLGLDAGLQPMAGLGLVLVVADTVIRTLIGWLGRLVSRVVHLGLLGSGLGAALGALKQVVVLGVLINLLLFLPVIPQVRSLIQASTLAPRFVVHSVILERFLGEIVEPAIKELQSISTIVTISDDPVSLDTPVQSLVVDRQAEQELLRLVNVERRERGLVELTWSDQLAEVGRAHSRDMWTRQFFAHVNPDGQTPFDRLDAAGIQYRAAGENLALAPTTPVAHQGLMDSPGHRANILSPDYRRLGIGAIRNGLYGIMFTQLFTD